MATIPARPVAVGTTDEWAASLHPLSKRRLGLDLDTGVLKLGDGVSLWADLDAVSLAGGGGGGGGQGILFGQDTNTGDFLSVQASEGILFDAQAAGATPGADIEFDGGAGGISLYCSDGGTVQVDAAGLQVTTGDQGVEITDPSDYGIYVTNSGGGDVELNAGGGSAATVRVQSNASGKLAFFGNPGVVRPNSVPVTAADIHAALVSLGLIVGA